MRACLHSDNNELSGHSSCANENTWGKNIVGWHGVTKKKIPLGLRPSRRPAGTVVNIRDPSFSTCILSFSVLQMSCNDLRRELDLSLLLLLIPSQDQKSKHAEFTARFIAMLLQWWLWTLSVATSVPDRVSEAGAATGQVHSANHCSSFATQEARMRLSKLRWNLTLKALYRKVQLSLVIPGCTRKDPWWSKVASKMILDESLLGTKRTCEQS